MNCPNCKNPISDNSQECEWCGCDIVQTNFKNTNDSDIKESIKIKVDTIYFIENELRLESKIIDGSLILGNYYSIEINNIKNIGKLFQIVKFGGFFSKDNYFNECNSNLDIDGICFQIENYNGGWKSLENEQTFVEDIKNFSFSINQI